MPDRRSTRQRLLEAGMRLFATQGYGATSVADVEAAVGLQPRRGGLYKHFANKQALLEAAVQQHLDSAKSLAREVAAVEGAPPAGSLRDQIEAFGRAFLAEMDTHETLTRILEHDAARMPQLAADFRSDLVDFGYRTAADLIATFAPGLEDPEAISVILLGALVALRRTTWTFGQPPLGIDDVRVLRAWADLALAAVHDLDDTAQPAPDTPSTTPGGSTSTTTPRSSAT